MATLAKLVVELGLDESGFSAGLRKTQDKLKGWGESLSKAGQMATTRFTLPVVAGFGFAVKAASDLGEATSLTGRIFGDSSKDVLAWGKTTADAYGISNAESLTAVNNLGALMTQTGLTQEAASGLGMSLVGVAGDMASAINRSPIDTLAAIRSAILGQYEPLAGMNIKLTEAMVTQRALADSGKKSAEQLTEQEKVMARYNLILEGQGAMAGDAALTHDSFANSLRRVRAKATDLAAKIGVRLLPYAVRLVAFVEKLVERFDTLSPRMQKIIIVVLGLAAALGPVLMVIGAMLPALALLLGPIGLIIVALALLGTAYATNFLGFRDAVNWVVEAFVDLVSIFKQAFDAGTSNKDLVKLFPEPLRQFAEGVLKIVDALGDLYRAFKDGGLNGLLEALPGELAQIWRGMVDIAKAGWEALKSAISGIDWGAVWEGVKSAGIWFVQALGDVAIAIGTWAYEQIKNVNWSGVWEAVKDAGRWLVTNLGEIAEDVYTWASGQFALVDWKGAVGTLSEILYDKGMQLLDGLWGGAKGKWAEVWGWLNNRGRVAIEAVGVVAQTLLQKGKDLLQGMWDGGVTVWTLVYSWLASRKTVAVHGIGNLLKTLWDAGVDLIEGLWNGAGDQWDSFTDWLAGLGGTIAGWVGKLGGVLYDKGRELVQGFINGIESMIGALAGKVNQAITAYNKVPLLPDLPYVGTASGASVNPGNIRASGFASGSTVGAITINVNGAGDPRAVADQVFEVFAREMALATGAL